MTHKSPKSDFDTPRYGQNNFSHQVNRTPD